MTARVNSDERIFHMVSEEMRRVDHLRMKLNLHRPGSVWPEFWMRRALLRSRMALMQRNVKEALRMLKVMQQIENENGSGYSIEP